jgi:5-enolpyruvylshikimate-3-phosphate synthase
VSESQRWTELSKCGAKVIETGDTLTVCPLNYTAPRSNANDQRVAMVLPFLIESPARQNPAQKAFPNFSETGGVTALRWAPRFSMPRPAND